MLGYVISAVRGDGDLLLAQVADRLQAAGWPLAGAVQVNRDGPPGAPCSMVLAVLAGGGQVCISQRLGPGSTGCRLDQAALEQAVGLVEAGLVEAGLVEAGLVEQGLEPALPRLMIVNKFGKAEAEGRGFRPLIGRVLGMGIPVLCGVNARNLAAFEDFAGGMGQALPAEVAGILRWCGAQAGV